MKLVFSAHAVEQMLSRKISPAEVEKLMLHPDGEIKQSRDKSVFYKRVLNRKDNLIAVVAVMQAGRTYEIITVMHNFEVHL